MIVQQLPRHLSPPNGPPQAATPIYPLAPVRPNCLTKVQGIDYFQSLTTVTDSKKTDINFFLKIHFPSDKYPPFEPPSHTPYLEALTQYIDFVTQLDPFTPSPFSDGDMGSHHMFHSMTGTQTLTQETLTASGLSDANARQLLATLQTHHIIEENGTVICRLEPWTLDTLIPIIQTAPDPSSLLTHTPTIMAQLNVFLPHRHQGTVGHDELYLQLNQGNVPSLLGQGNFGVVHKALLIAPNGTALSGALKQSLHFSPDALGNYMNEVAMQKRASDCSASIYNAFYMPISGTRTPTFAIFMEKGTPSSSPLNLPNPTVSLSALSQLPKRLQQLNVESDILHRDLKPTNIVMMDGTTKLIDFGTSIPMDNLTHAQTVGSPAHMAPEVIKAGLSNATEDVWSLGTLLFSTLSHGQYYVTCFQPNTSLLEMLYAEPPPPLDNVMRLLYRIGFELQKPIPVDSDELHERFPNLAPESGELLTRFFDLFTQILDPDPRTRPSIQAVLEHPGSAIFQEPHRHLLSLLQTGLDSVDATSKRKLDADIMIHAPTGQRSMRECLTEKGVQSKGIDPVLLTLGSMGLVDEDGQIRLFKQTDLSALELRLKKSPLCSEVLTILNECVHARHGYTRDGIDLYYEVVPHQLRPKDLQALGFNKQQAKQRLDSLKQQGFLNDDGTLSSDPSLQQAITYQPDDSVDTTKLKIALNNCYDSNQPHRRILGIGAHGTVYKTWEKEDNDSYSPYALKKQKFDSPESLKPLKVESLLTQQLLSSSTPLLKDDTTLLMPGLPLGTTFPSQQLSVPHTHFCDLCRCINELHNVNRVEHQDLKPSNVMITADGTLSTLDFGGSRRSDSPDEIVQDSTCDKVVFGSPLWMPPEAFKDKNTPQVFGASDVWSLGIQLFSLLSVNNGQFSSHYVHNYRRDTPLEALLIAPQPPNKETFESLIQQQQRLSPPTTHTQHPILDLLAGMLHPDPTQRLTINTCLQHVGFELLDSILCSPDPHMAITRFHGELEGVLTITTQGLDSPTKASACTTPTTVPSDTWPLSPLSPIYSRDRHTNQVPSVLLKRRVSR